MEEEDALADILQNLSPNFYMPNSKKITAKISVTEHTQMCCLIKNKKSEQS